MGRGRRHRVLSSLPGAGGLGRVAGLGWWWPCLGLRLCWAKGSTQPGHLETSPATQLGRQEPGPGEPQMVVRQTGIRLLGSHTGPGGLSGWRIESVVTAGASRGGPGPGPTGTAAEAAGAPGVAGGAGEDPPEARGAWGWGAAAGAYRVGPGPGVTAGAGSSALGPGAAASVDSAVGGPAVKIRGAHASLGPQPIAGADGGPGDQADPGGTFGAGMG